jgi:hypothetical protein
VAALLALASLGCALSAPAALAKAPAGPVVVSEPRPLDGAGTNPLHPDWGVAGTPYARLVAPRYADEVSTPVGGPNPRYVSNRVFNSLGVDLFSPRNVSQWVWVWGQFLDHNFELAQGGSEYSPIPVDQEDPLERFSDSLGVIPFARDAAAPGTGTSSQDPRQQINTIPSYIDGYALYGDSQSRLEWMRTGPDDGNPDDAGAAIMLPGGYLPTSSARGEAASAPQMLEEGALTQPQAAVAGDVRANENAALDGVTTLFAREHNRIVSLLPASLSDEQKFQIARRVVGAEIQYITYTAFLPAVGVQLPSYAGYDSSVDPAITNEFATVGYRAHSMVNGEEEILAPAADYSPSQLEALQALGVAVTPVSSRRTQGERLEISQGAAFFDPALVPAVGLGNLLAGLSQAPGYKNDEQIDDELRSVLFETPGSERTPAECFEEPQRSGCYSGIVDLGAIDIERGRDHGTPSYARLRGALGLEVPSSFDQLTGEHTEELPKGLTIDDPAIMQFTSLRETEGLARPADEVGKPRYATRRSTLAARLKAIYGSVGNLDAFVGMVSEPSPPTSELGPLQSALWRRQFQALRDGDRFFYLNDPVLASIKRAYKVTYKHTLAQLLTLDAGVSRKEVPPDVFFARAPKLH